jgi:hypothetical protein
LIIGIREPKKKMIHRKPKNVGAGYARPNIFGFYILCKSLSNQALTQRLKVAPLRGATLRRWACILSHF